MTAIFPWTGSTQSSHLGAEQTLSSGRTCLLSTPGHGQHRALTRGRSGSGLQARLTCYLPLDRVHPKLTPGGGADLVFRCRTCLLSTPGQGPPRAHTMHWVRVTMSSGRLACYLPLDASKRNAHYRRRCWGPCPFPELFFPFVDNFNIPVIPTASWDTTGPT